MYSPPQRHTSPVSATTSARKRPTSRTVAKLQALVVLLLLVVVVIHRFEERRAGSRERYIIDFRIWSICIIKHTRTDTYKRAQERRRVEKVDARRPPRNNAKCTPGTNCQGQERERERRGDAVEYNRQKRGCGERTHLQLQKLALRGEDGETTAAVERVGS